MRTISYDVLLDRIHGGWIGKALGGTIGRFEGTKRITFFDIMELMPDAMQPNDDLDIQLVWLDVLLEKGVFFTGDDLMRAWIDEYDYNFGEYAYGRRNWLRGLHPPVCGDYANIYYKTGMGCPIRSEVWGMIAPGSHKLAAAYAEIDGTLDHEGESVWAERMLSVMESEAFFTSDLRALIDVGLGVVPADSLVRRCVAHAIALFDAGLSWQDAWRELMAEHSHPDCTYTPFNLGIIVMALLYGGGDMERTLTIAVNAGWDVDCTCSTTAAILGLLSGASGIDGKWKAAISDEVVTLARPRHDLSSLRGISEITARAAVTLLRAGRLDIDITGIPADLPLLKAEAPPPVVMSIQYAGYPAARAGDEKELILSIASNASEPIRDELIWYGPEGATLPGPARLELPAGETLEIPISLTLPMSGILSDANRFTARFAGHTHEFGLCGAPDARVLGPFFDTYEQWCEAEGGGQMLKTPGFTIRTPLFGEEWGNHRVDIDKAYIDENWGADQTRAAFSKGKKVAVYEDSYCIDRAYGLSGPCVCYWYQELISHIEQDVQFFIGSSDPAKVWLNGESVFAQSENRFYYSNNDVVDVRLRAGVNVLILKTARVGGAQRLTLCVREVPRLAGYDSCPFVMGLSWSTL